MDKLPIRCHVCGSGQKIESKEACCSDTYGEYHDLNPSDSTFDMLFGEDAYIHVAIAGIKPESKLDDTVVHYASFPAKFCPCCGRSLKVVKIERSINERLSSGEMSINEAMLRYRILRYKEQSYFVPISDIRAMVRDALNRKDVSPEEAMKILFEESPC